MGQQALIEGVLSNLLDNAMRYGRSTTDTPSRLTLSLEVLGAGPMLSAGKALQEGAGLGLAIVAEYARLLKAGLWLGTAPGGPGLQVALLFEVPTATSESAEGRRA